MFECLFCKSENSIIVGKIRIEDKTSIWQAKCKKCEAAGPAIGFFEDKKPNYGKEKALKCFINGHM